MEYYYHILSYEDKKIYLIPTIHTMENTLAEKLSKKINKILPQNAKVLKESCGEVPQKEFGKVFNNMKKGKTLNEIIKTNRDKLFNHFSKNINLRRFILFIYGDVLEKVSFLDEMIYPKACSALDKEDLSDELTFILKHVVKFYLRDLKNITDGEEMFEISKKIHEKIYKEATDASPLMKKTLSHDRLVKGMTKQQANYIIKNLIIKRNKKWVEIINRELPKHSTLIVVCGKAHCQDLIERLGWEKKDATISL